MPKLYDQGGQIDQMTCGYCKRIFRGDYRSVNKLIRLHLLKEHGITEYSVPKKPESVTYSLQPKTAITPS